MTKKEIILEKALNLFAKDGFNGVSTAKIAKDAGVSEGLIFRHFKNKRGLLDAIIEDLQEEINLIIAPVIKIKDPKLAIETSIASLLTLNPEKYNYWKLQFKLKLDDNYDTKDKIQPFIDFLEQNFKALNFENPKQEAQLLFEIMDTTFANIVTGKLEDKEAYVNFLLKKYKKQIS